MSSQADSTTPNRRFALGLARAFGGAVVFTLPLYMTMEMWQLGFTMDRGRLALLAALTMPLLVGLSHVSGFEPTFDVLDDVVDAGVAWAVGIVAGLVGLFLLGALQRDQSISEIIGKLTLQAIPGSIGALLAHSQFSDSGNVGESGDDGDQTDEGDEDDGGTQNAAPRDDGANDDEKERDGSARPDSYWSQLFVMTAGALFLAFNVAPTEEIIHIAYVLSPWRMLVLVLLSLIAMHAFVYKIDAQGQEQGRGSMLSIAFRYTVVGYGIAVAISAYVLWTFGRLDATGSAEAAMTVLVLAVPAAIGAAAARLLL